MQTRLRPLRSSPKSRLVPVKASELLVGMKLWFDLIRLKLVLVPSLKSNPKSLKALNPWPCPAIWSTVL